MQNSRAKFATEQITKFIRSRPGATKASVEELFPLVYDELRRLAAGQLRRMQGPKSLQATALVHEAYLKMAERESAEWQDRTHFVALGAIAMRHVLVDHARRRGAQKRGGNVKPVTLNEELIAGDEGEIDVLFLEEHLRRLEGANARQARIVELRFYGGMSSDEIAEVLGIASRTVKRDWQSARAWLMIEMAGTELGKN